MDWTYTKTRDGKREELLTETFGNHLGLGNVKIEKRNRIGNPKISRKLKIVVTLARYKDKQKNLSKCNCPKGTGIYIKKDILKETVKFRKQNWDRVKALRKQGKYAILVYYRIY